MSKIEDALNRVKKSNGTSLSVIGSNASKDLAINNVSSAKEIALMQNKKYLDNNELSEMKIIHPDMLDTHIADTYRDLRTKIIQKCKGKNASIMLTSCVAGHYSHMTTLNLAAAFAFDESKTSLLVDCNLSNPQLDEVLNLSTSNGLTDYLENESIPVESIVQESGIKRMRVIPAGTSRETASEYFTSLKMRDLMSGLLARYSDRYMFVDTLPIVESADTRILVELCDYVLLVVPYGKSTKSRIQEAAEAIGTEKLLGIVFVDKPTLPSFENVKNSKKY